MLGFLFILADKLFTLMNHFSRVFFLLLVVGLAGCKPDVEQQSSNTLVVRISAELNGLNPVISRPVGSNRLMTQILPSLVDFDPKTLQMAPVLIEALPKKVELSGDNEGKVAYQFHFRKEAKWPNGSPITIKDYIFSLKVAFNRKIRGNSWTRPLAIIEGVIENPNDDKEGTVILTRDGESIMGYFAGFELLPEYQYDPNHLLQPFALKDFVGVENFDKLWTKHPEIAEFAQAFSQEKYVRSPDGVTGAGPYRLDDWVTNEQITLVKRANYWADNLKIPLLDNFPDTIIYQIVADEVATVQKIKNVELDIVADMSPGQFVKLKQNPNVTKNYDFYTPVSQKFYLFLMNNQLPKLDKSVRNALARCIDLDQLLDVAAAGLGEKIISPLSPQSYYYHKGLKPIQKNLDKAKSLLAQAGWKDSNGDGTVEKEINGVAVPLEIDLLIGGTNSIARAIAPIFKSEAAKIGVKINVVSTNGREFMSKVRGPKFEMAIARFIASPTDYMPYGSWHSDNAGKKGKNYARYSSSQMDAVISQLQKASTTEAKQQAYTKFQEILYEDQPVLFLFSPVKTVIVQNRWEPVVAAIRPGYFENSFQLKKK